jgi:hypothetical protein
MKLLKIIFGRWASREVSKPITIDRNEPEMVELELELYQWFCPVYRAEAEVRLQEVHSAMGLGLRNQAIFSAREVAVLFFRDFVEANGLNVYELCFEPSAYDYDMGLYRIKGMLDLWAMHDTDSEVVRLPQGALKALENLKIFPNFFIQEVKILQKVEKWNSVPESLLAVKVGDRWFSVFR